MIYLEIALAIAVGVACYFGIRYITVKLDVRHAKRQMLEIRQNPEDNRILLLVHANKEMEDFLQECNLYIEQSQQMRIRYANREQKLRRQIEGISHDLRTPLTAILGYLEMIDRESLDEDDAASLEVVERKSRNLQRLISNFYDLSRLELDDYNLNMEILDLSRLVREGMLSQYELLAQRGLLVELDCDKRFRINGDRVALERIINNMIQNAVRYAESKLQVAVGKTPEGEIFISFANDTLSLKEEEIPHLFERFYMSDASRNGKGTGLGLTISKLLAEAMGGSASARLDGKILTVEYRFPGVEE